MRSNRFALVAALLAWPALIAPAPGQEKAHPDHMEHRFNNPEASARSFDDPARDAWQLPDRVIAALVGAPV